MDALPLVRFRLQLADGSRWWRAQCDWTQPAPNVLRLSVEAIVLTDDRGEVWPVEAVAITLCARAGVPLDVVQRWVGHADLTTTQGYLVTLVSDADLRAPALGV